MLSRINYCYF